MVGQEELVAKLKSYTIDTLPHSILLLGESGCGKHTLAKELAEYFNVELIDITEDISFETLTDISLKASPAFYLISIDSIDEKQQNKILKFVEEPSVYAYVILISNSKYNVLETLYNRCIVFQFDKYEIDDLRHFVEGEDISNDLVELCSTPGQIKMIINYYNELVNTCNNFTNKLKKASFNNVIRNIVYKINYKDEYDKFDMTLFLRALKRSLYNDYVKTKDELVYVLYNIVVEQCDKLVDKRLNKQLFMEHLLSTCWLTVRGEC